MASSFMGLYVQRDALMIAQKSLDITGNNISNANVPGYSRQRVDVCSIANTKGSLFYNTGISLAGRGAEAVGVAQIRDAILDRKYRTYSSDFMNTGVKVKTLSDLEDAFDNIESNEYGLANVLNNFKAALQSHSVDNADRVEFSNTVMTNAESIANALGAYIKRLDDISESTLEETNVTVDRVNAILAEMASLNDDIKNSYVSMGYIDPSGTNSGYMADNKYGPLELKDKMNLLVDELAQYGNVSTKEENDGTFTVKFADQTVVNRRQYAQMAMADPDDNPGPKEMEFVILGAGTYDPSTERFSGLMEKKQWDAIGMTPDAIKDYLRAAPGGDTVSINASGRDENGVEALNSGSLRGFLDMYNGNGTYADVVNGENEYEGIEYYRSMLNAFAKTFADEYNAVYESEGVELFEYDETNFDNIAKTLRVSQQWKDAPTIIAFPETGGVPDEHGALNNVWINKMLGVFDSKHEYGNGTTFAESKEYNFYEYLTYFNVTKLGGKLNYEEGVFTAEQIMLNGVQDQRDEVMSVSIEEEGIDMLKHQKWYNAIARVITSMDEMLDKLINGTGRVGL